VPVFAQFQPAPVAFPNSGGPSQRRVEARDCARLPALIATLPSADREIVLLRVVAGVSLPGVVATLSRRHHGRRWHYRAMVQAVASRRGQSRRRCWHARPRGDLGVAVDVYSDDGVDSPADEGW
jgi:hypothetical protein